MDTLEITNYYFVLCGIPGSGKSTLANKFAKIYNAKLYSYDEIFSKDKLKNSHEVRNTILQSISNDLQNGFNVILDDSNILTNLRTEVLEKVKNIDCNKVLVVMDTPLNKCLLRNANRKKRLPYWVIEHMYRKYQIPTLDEGWDEIIYYKGE